MSRQRDRGALRREERRLGELRRVAARAQGAAMGRLAPGLAGAVAAFAPLAGLAFLVAAAPLDRAWQDAAAARLVVVPDPDQPAAASGSAATSRIAAVSQLLGDAARTPPDGATLRRSLAAWLGSDIDAATLPGVLTVAGTPDPALVARLAAAAPGTTIASVPADTATSLGRLDAMLRLAGRAGVALGLLLGAGALAIAGRLAVAPARERIRVLSVLGERPGVLARRAALRAGFATAAGALGGTALAIPLLLLAAAGAPAAAALVAAGAAPPLCGAIGGVAAGLGAHAAARRLA